MPHPVDIHVGKRIKQVRVLRGMSQTVVAAQLDVSFQQVQKYETGANRVSASRLYELSKILTVEPCYFFQDLSSDSEEETVDLAMEIATAIAAITDENHKRRVLTFINDVSGVTAARGT